MLVKKSVGWRGDGFDGTKRDWNGMGLLDGSFCSGLSVLIAMGVSFCQLKRRRKGS